MAMQRIPFLLAPLLAAFGCSNGPWHIPHAVYDRGIAAWSYVEPPLAERHAPPLPAVRVADFESFPPEVSYHPSLPFAALTLPLVGWTNPPFIATQNSVLLPTTWGSEYATLRPYEFERILARELARSGAFEAVVTDPAKAHLELRGRIDFRRRHSAHFMGLGPLWLPLFYWVPPTTQRDDCEASFQLVRLADGRVLREGNVQIESRQLVRYNLGNEILLTNFEARILPPVIERIVREVASVETQER